MEGTSKYNLEYINCRSCDASVLQSKKFSVYDKNFCSLDCLQKFKRLEDSKNDKKQHTASYRKSDFGGSACY